MLTGQHRLRHDFAPVPPENAPQPAASEQIAELRDEVTELKNQVRVLSDILDEIRVDLQWVTRNGLPIREPSPSCPTLKRMALNPCADDWSERLVINYGTPDPNPDATESRSDECTHAGSPPPSASLAPSDELFATTGEQRRLF
jgi:hypothetical protein